MSINPVKLYHLTNYIPFVSVVPNTITLIAKGVFHYCGDGSNGAPGSFKAYVMEQSTKRCVINIITLGLSTYCFAVYDMRHQMPQTAVISVPETQNNINMLFEAANAYDKLPRLPIEKIDGEDYPCIAYEDMEHGIMRGTDKWDREFLAFRISFTIPQSEVDKLDAHLADYLRGKNCEQKKVLVLFQRDTKHKTIWNTSFQVLTNPVPFFKSSFDSKSGPTTEEDKKGFTRLQLFIKTGKLEHEGYIYTLGEPKKDVIKEF